MDAFLKTYNDKPLEDNIMYNSNDVKSFARKFKNYLKRNVPDCNIENYTLGHYFISGFLRKDGQHLYFSYDVPRYEQPVDIYAGQNGYEFDKNCVLIRTAENETDYHGGRNHYCSLANFPQTVEHMFDKYATC